MDKVMAEIQTSGLTNDTLEAYGGWVNVNDDNRNGTNDLEDVGAVLGENDLLEKPLELSIQLAPSGESRSAIRTGIREMSLFIIIRTDAESVNKIRVFRKQ